MTIEANMESTGSWAAAEQGDSSSAEEVESPRSVVTAARRGGGGRLRRWRKGSSGGNQKDSGNGNNRCYLHSQVLRIKEEELQIGEDLMGDNYYDNNYMGASPPLDERVVSWARAILPASPLGGRKSDRNECNF